MGLHHLLAFLPLAVTLAQAQTDVTTTEATAAANVFDEPALTNVPLDGGIITNATTANATTTEATAAANVFDESSLTNATLDGVIITNATTANTTTIDANTTEAPTTGPTAPEIVQSPSYTVEDCNRWITTLISKDVDNSTGLSAPEYFSFLSGIEDPPYISEYFAEFASFDQLPWVFRVVHKSLACHCEKLGMGGGCCKGGNAQVQLLGLDTNGKTRNSVEEEYKDLFCQQISYVLTNSVRSPAPTSEPTQSPTKSPSFSPTASPSKSPSFSPSASPSASPSKSPSAGPTASPSKSPSAGPTASPSLGPVTIITTKSPSESPTSKPTVAPTISSIPTVLVNNDKLRVETQGDRDEEDDGVLGYPAIIGIVVAILLLLVVLIALVVYRRRQTEQDQLRKFAGNQAPEADLEDPPTVDLAPERVPAPQMAPEVGAPGEAPDEDDESSAPSVWSESDNEDALDELHDDHEDPGATAGSALAAMGAASTVTARIGAASPVSTNSLV